jgi:hypothetical protein
LDEKQTRKKSGGGKRESGGSKRGSGGGKHELGSRMPDGRIALEPGLPEAIPAGFLLVHDEAAGRRVNEGLAATGEAEGGRAWLQPEALAMPSVVSCECGWAPDLGDHYTVAPP